MDQPAARWLRADITAGRVDTVVVYKVDRLTSSLTDFAKIVEVPDASGAFFVSVTRQVQHDDLDGAPDLEGFVVFCTI